MRRSLRNLARSPGFTSAALLTLALGIGVNTTAFTALNQLLLQAVPFRDPDRIVRIWASEPRRTNGGVSPGDFFDLKEAGRAFDAVAVYDDNSGDSLVEAGKPAARVSANHVSADFFKVLGVEPQLGRSFSHDEEEHMDPVTLIANYYWREHFGADPNILGRSVRLNGKTVTIIGVLPVGMDSPTLFNERIAFWSLDPTRLNVGLRNMSWYSAVARLKPGVSLAQARTDLSATALRLAKEFPATNAHRTFKAEVFATSTFSGLGSQLTWMVMAVSGLILAIACVNLANLQIVRVTKRGQEMAVRLALGCSRSRIVAMLLEESLVLSAMGGLLALLVAKWGNDYAGNFLNISMPLDARVLTFTFVVSLATGVAFGVFPALVASKQNINDALKAGARGSTSGWARRAFREVLVVTELIMALVVLSAAAFFVVGIYKLSHQDLGWDGDHAIFGQLTLDHDHYGERGDPRSLALTDRLKAELEALPGVKVAAAGAAVPPFQFGGLSYRIDGKSAPEPGHESYVDSGNVDPGFFGIYGVPVVKGRDFDASDRIGTRHVVIINESMARKCWPGEDPVGKRIGLIDSSRDGTAVDWSEVVGVVRDYHHLFDLLGGSDGTMLFRPWAQNSHRWVFFHVGTRVDPDALLESIRRTVAKVVPDFALDQLVPVRTMALDAFTYFAFLRKALVELSVLGLTLSAVGIYGVIATLTAERTREVGIRLALGARGQGIVWLFVRSALGLSLFAAAIGGGIALGIIHTLSSMMPFLPPCSPWLILPIAGLVFAVAMVSSWIPALRSTRVDLSAALRSE